MQTSPSLRHCGELEPPLGSARMVRASRVPEAEGGPDPAFVPPQRVTLSVPCCLVSRMLLLNKMRFSNS